MSEKIRVFFLSLIFISIFLVTPVAASTEEIGVWEGVSYDEDFEFDTSNGVTEEQFEKVVQRSMARVEKLRGRTFKETVPVEIYTRSRFKVSDEVVYNQEYTDKEKAYLNEYWNALFIVDQQTSAIEAQRSVTLQNVEAYYNPTNERIVFIAQDNATNNKYSVQEPVLIQELTHAMQDQYEGLWTDNLSYKYTDEQLSKSMFIEGEAATIVNAFQSKCTSDWDCIQGTSTVTQFNGDRNRGILYSLYYPYATGEEYIYSQSGDTLKEKINTGYSNVPTQTRQYLVEDPEIKDPVELFLEDTSTERWESYNSYNWRGRETVGQSVLYTMLWYQQEKYNIDLGVKDITETDASKKHETHNYRSDLTLDLIADSMMVYRNTESNKNGHVWKTVWRDNSAAGTFISKYTTILSEHGGKQKGLSTVYSQDVVDYIETETETALVYEITQGGFSGKYVVLQDNNTVLIINADSNAAIKQIRDIADEPTFTTSNTLESIAEKNDTTVEEPDTQYITYFKSNLLSLSVIFGLLLLYMGMYYRDVLK